MWNILRTAANSALRRFATHYHELTELENQMDGVKNYNIAVKKRGDDIAFLRRFFSARRTATAASKWPNAGVPEPIVRRAKEILVLLESGESAGKPCKKSAAQPAPAMQLAFGEEKYQEIADRLKRVDVDNVTAKQALDILYELSLLLAKAEK
ncbi:MAG: MutS-related protein [Oscillospiraceae bacterium]